MQALAESGESVEAYLTRLELEGKSPSRMCHEASPVRMEENLGFLCFFGIHTAPHQGDSERGAEAAIAQGGS